MESSQKPNKSHRKRNIIIAIVLVIVVILSSLVFIYNRLFSDLTTVDISDKEEDLNIKPNITRNQDIINLALFGIDTRENTYDGSRTDTIMIVSIDNKHNKIKISSIMRDTYVDIPGVKTDKINHAYAYGGPELSIRTINQNFDMDIKDYVTVNFVALEKIIDELGGVQIDVKPEEVSHVREGAVAGVQTLTGKQAVNYCRIRYVGNADYERTERQRRVLTQVIGKLQQEKSLSTLLNLLDMAMPNVETSLSKTEIMNMGAKILATGTRDIEETRLPLSTNSKGTMIDGVYYLVPQTLEDNVKHLHEFIYEEDK